MRLQSMFRTEKREKVAVTVCYLLESLYNRVLQRGEDRSIKKTNNNELEVD